MDERKAFEAWAMSNRYEVGHQGAGGQYLGMATAIAWEAWKAAIKHERERCATTCEARAEAYRRTRAPGWNEVDHECTQCAAAIRAASQGGEDR